MIKYARWAAALALLPLAACNTNKSDAFSGTVPQPMPAAPTASAADQKFAQQAASSDQFEIQSSQLALQKSHSARVRAFAQQMIDEHTATTQKLSALAGTKGMTVDGALDPTQQQTLASLQNSRSGFDRAYLRAQVNGHDTALSAFQTKASGGSDPDVRSFAQQTAPTIQEHLDEAKRMAGR